MLNKKIIAVAVAAAFAHNASAVVNLDTNSGPVTYANDIVNFSLETNGNLEVSNTSNLLDISTSLGFTIGAGTSKYVLIELEGAQFDAAPTLDVAGTPGTVSQGGGIGQSFVLFEVAQPEGVADLDQTSVVTLTAAGYEVDPEVTSTATYRLFETAERAIEALAGETVTALATKAGDFTNTASGSSGDFANGFINTATVQSTFTEFNGASLSAATAAIGEIDTDNLVADPTYTPSGVITVATDFLEDTQDINFIGDMSFGTWTLQTTDQCDGSGTSYPLLNTSETGGELLNFDDTTLAATTLTLCVTVDGDEKIEKGSYQVNLEEDDLTDEIGVINYDTTTIEVPYITTFYNQRLILVNTSNEPAAFTVSFQQEADTTATSLLTGDEVIPAKGMVVLSTQGQNPFVEITGERTRASATIEVESVDGNIQAATQTVSSDGTATDTVVLNANSVISYNTLVDLIENNKQQ